MVELLTMVLGPNSLLVAARVDFAHGLDDDDVERVSEPISVVSVKWSPTSPRSF